MVLNGADTGWVAKYLEADAEIQPGSYFGRLDMLGDGSSATTRDN
jgi:hypothetical protein